MDDSAIDLTEWSDLKLKTYLHHRARQIFIFLPIYFLAVRVCMIFEQDLSTKMHSIREDAAVNVFDEDRRLLLIFCIGGMFAACLCFSVLVYLGCQYRKTLLYTYCLYLREKERRSQGEVYMVAEDADPDEIMLELAIIAARRQQIPYAKLMSLQCFCTAAMFKALILVDYNGGLQYNISVAYGKCKWIGIIYVCNNCLRGFSYIGFYLIAGLGCFVLALYLTSNRTYLMSCCGKRKFPDIQSTNVRRN